MNFLSIHRLAFSFCTVFLLALGGLGASRLQAAESAANKLAALSLELANASNRVVQIVEQPVPTYGNYPGMEYFTYRDGWFHPGAIKPNFNTVDVRKTQETPYGHEIVTSPLNPGVFFHGEDLEFNSMTKYFITNRSIPKHKLTEAQMIEINSLYRIIGRCEGEIQRLNEPTASSTGSSGEVSTTSTKTVPEDSLIHGISNQMLSLYGALGIGALILLSKIIGSFRSTADE